MPGTTSRYSRYLRQLALILAVAWLWSVASTAIAAKQAQRDALAARNDLPRYLAKSETITRTLIRKLQQNPTYKPTTAEADELGMRLEHLDEADLFREYVADWHGIGRGEGRQPAMATFKRLARLGDGSAERPVPVVSGAEAFAYARMDDAIVLGGIYQAPKDLGLRLILLVSKSAERGHEELHFHLQAVSESLRAMQQTSKSVRSETLIAQLAQAGDEWAMATVGESLRQHAELSDKALFWLESSHQKGNLVSTLLLAKLHLGINSQTTGQPRPHLKEARNLYLSAIARNSDTAMVQLGLIYYQGWLGPDQVSIGISLLEQARALRNLDALLTLAEIYSSKRPIKIGRDESLTLHSATATAKMLREAGDAGHQGARFAYAQFYVNHDQGKQFNRRAFRWLKEIATDKGSADSSPALSPELQAEALLLLGWVSARGLIAKHDFNAAKSYWLQATERHSSPKILNEVAYTLVAINTPELRDADNALRLIEKLMTETEDESVLNNYAYLDTWASAYAAKGRFGRAIEIQERALQAMISDDVSTSDTEQEMLKSHLRAFRRGELIYDVELYQNN